MDWPKFHTHMAHLTANLIHGLLLVSCFSIAAVIEKVPCVQEIWSAELDEELTWEREVGNRHDTLAVVMRKDSGTVSHAGHFTYLSNISTTKQKDQVQSHWKWTILFWLTTLPCILTFSIWDQRESSKTEKVSNDLLWYDESREISSRVTLSRERYQWHQQCYQVQYLSDLHRWQWRQV